MKHITGKLHRAVITLLCFLVNRIRITVRLRFVKVVLKVGCFDILVGFEILGITYVEHGIM